MLHSFNVSHCMQLISILTYPITLIVCNWFQLVWIKTPVAWSHVAWTSRTADPLRSIMLDGVQAHAAPHYPPDTKLSSLHYAQYAEQTRFCALCTFLSVWLNQKRSLDLRIPADGKVRSKNVIPAYDCTRLSNPCFAYIACSALKSHHLQ